MKFTNLSFDPSLKDHVLAVWQLEYAEGADQELNFIEFLTFACAYPTLVFQYQGIGFLRTSLQRPAAVIPRNHFTGIVTQPIDICTSGPFAMVGVTLFPYATGTLFDFPVDKSINGIFGLKGFDKVYDTIEELTPAITAYIEGLIQESDPVDPIIQSAVQFIADNKGEGSISELSKYLGYSVRQVERKFQRYIGVSPKEFAKIVRFQNTLKVTPHDMGLTQLALFNGYSDQSHFIRDFKKLSGIKPKDYFFQDQRMGIGFIKYS
ncbi:helix-turn-helix domain-containing protein [Aureisphaera galaxeae]|uniref:helix-turn-helix domain-containing protein n=1 Tax=Aureisphaera galaxeae TaxID=1538023 RepID=UPI002350A7EF|nr:helix-turn-helix domain-containing protein [Aureisphaera galaxeae]MDC8004154.1 helix-turn-helix domain-containing protein [Aureisphaera galaxeae]